MGNTSTRANQIARNTLFIIGLSCLLPAVARSTTFVLMDEHSLMESSAAVIVGTITGVESGAAAPDGAISTYVHVQPERIVKGALGLEPLILREPGGMAADQYQVVEGAPAFWPGERALLFLSRNRDGTLQTNSLAMGKYSLSVDASGHTIAVRDFGEGSSVLAPETGQITPAQRQSERFLPLLRRLRRQARVEREAGRAQRPLTLVPEELNNPNTRFHENYVFLSNPPSRWFQPDSGQPVVYYVDSTGDSKLGFAASQAAIDGALAAWTNVATSNLVLQDGGTTSAAPFGPCDMNRIVFNDPYNEVSDPTNCGGVLAIGGYCGGYATTVVNGTTFNQITIGKVTFNNGWGGCSAWTQCNVAEVATHEIGHTIGLGHSLDTTATMYAMAHFDGRCAKVMTDDINGVSFAYPQTGTAVPTSTPTVVRNTATPIPATSTPTRAMTPTPTRAVPPTATFTIKPTATWTFRPTATPTLKPAATSTPRPTATWTRIPTKTPTSTPRPTGSVGAPNDACSNAMVVSAGSLITTVNTTSATSDPTDPIPSCNVNARARTIWYKYTAPASGTVVASTAGSTYNTVLSAYVGACGGMTPVFGGCNDNMSWYTQQSQVTITVAAGRTYYFMVSSPSTSTGGTASFRLTQY